MSYNKATTVNYFQLIAILQLKLIIYTYIILSLMFIISRLRYRIWRFSNPLIYSQIPSNVLKIIYLSTLYII